MVPLADYRWRPGFVSRRGAPAQLSCSAEEDPLAMTATALWWPWSQAIRPGGDGRFREVVVPEQTP